MNQRVFLSVACALLVASCGQSENEPDYGGLPALGADPVVTVSGISSGVYMADQYRVAFSGSVAGAALVAGGPWGCAQGDLKTALGPCLLGEGIDLDALRSAAAKLETAGSIDALGNLDGQRLLFFRGSNDVVIPPKLFSAARDIFAAEEVETIDDVPATHGWVTLNTDNDCTTFSTPFLVNCDFDLAGAIAGHLYGDLAPRATDTTEALAFEQAPYGDDASLAETGYVYVPPSCETERCRIHVFFHGCEQSAATVGRAVVDNAGLNEWAESNQLIVLYPQVAPSSFAPLNPLGCWDWWGYTGDAYLTKDAPQLRAVHAMIERLSSR